MKVLLELRPALDGYSGIPQETRLLFLGLAATPGLEVAGLIQSSNLAVAPGLPPSESPAAAAMSGEERVNVLSKVVVSLQQGPSNRVEHVKRRFLMAFGATAAAIASSFGRQVRLGEFDPTRFRDFVWRSMFAKTLPESDFERVTSRAFRVLRWPWSGMHLVGVLFSGLGRALYPRLDTRGFDLMIVETPFPGRVSKGTSMVVRYHDAIPLLMPHTIKDRGYHRAAHYQALVRNARDGAWFACVSESTRNDLLSVMPQLAPRTVTIPNMVSHHFFPEHEPAGRVPEIIWSRKNRRAPLAGGAPLRPDALAEGPLQYLLMVCTIEPRKNHEALLDAWELLRTSECPNLELVFVGSPGWNHDSIMRRATPWLERGGLHLLEQVPSDDLRLLYRHAWVTVCPSFGEGFDFPGVEAMRSGGVVAASDIPVHRDVFGAACEYFSPYASSDLVRALRSLLGEQGEVRRDELRRLGDDVSRQYLPDCILPQWARFLEAVVAA